MTYIQKTQIRFAMLYMRIEAAETQKELARLRKIIGWLKYRNMLKASDLTFAYYDALNDSVLRKILIIGASQRAKKIVKAYKKISNNK